MIFWRKTIFASLACLLVFQTMGPAFVFAESTTGEEIQQLNDEIAARKVKIDQITAKISDYRSKISQAENQQASLVNEIEVLENHAAQTELEIELANEEIATTVSEIKIADEAIAQAEDDLDRQVNETASILREIHAADQVSLVEWVFGAESFSELFGRIEDLEIVQADLGETLEQTKQIKTSLLSYRQEQEDRLLALEDLQEELEGRIELLENQKEAKNVLIAETASSEAEFQKLLNDLLAEEQYVNRQIASLQYGIEEKLKAGDSVGDSSALSWPVEPLRGLSATFHDPTYPFRYLFEHPGVDIPTAVGTSVKSSAPGYVAWVREGTQYGYYVLVIHADGIATLYAHLSKILVEPDQFVDRGEAVGLSGGRPGMPGAGLSTGPHLHYEVRKDGIPVNPTNYLIAR